MSADQMKVNIFGIEYTLKADEDEAYVQEIAKYVDKKMREINRSQAINSNLKIAILAALNIADELFQGDKYRVRLVQQINEESRKLNRSLQEALDL
jgi:cell division protein ZapA